MKNTNDEIEYLMLFSSIHNNFLYNKMLLNDKLGDYYIDYEEWSIVKDGAGYTNIWIEPKSEIIYKPSFKSPFQNIEIKGLRILVKTKVITAREGNRLVNFEISGNFNPNTWYGRNNLNLNPIGEFVVSGFCRTIIEQDKLFSPYFLKYLDQNYSDFIFNSVKFFS